MAIQTLKKTRLQKCSQGCAAEDVASSVHVIEVGWAHNVSTFTFVLTEVLPIVAHISAHDPSSVAFKQHREEVTLGASRFKLQVQSIGICLYCSILVILGTTYSQDCVAPFSQFLFGMQLGLRALKKAGREHSMRRFVQDAAAAMPTLAADFEHIALCRFHVDLDTVVRPSHRKNFPDFLTSEDNDDA